MLLVALLACADDPEAEDRFWVREVDPPDGGQLLIAVSPVLVRFSGPLDLERCTSDTMRLDAIRDDGTVAFPIPLTFEATADGFVRFIHDGPLPAGWVYAITLRGGETGCTDENGTPLDPFLSLFEVP
jgi:hypothetical protein